MLDVGNVKGAVFSIAEKENKGVSWYYCDLQRDMLVSKYLQINLSC